MQNRLKKTCFTIAVGLVSCIMTMSPSFADNSSNTLVFEGFGGAFKKAAMASIVKPFEEKYGVNVIYVVGTSGQLLAKAREAERSGKQTMDVIWTSPLTHALGKAEGLFGKTTAKEVPNIKNVYDLAKDPDQIGVAHDLQALGLVYNKQIFAKNGWARPTSWADLYDQKYRGHVVAQNMPISYASAFLVKEALMNGGSVDSLQPGFDELKRLVNNDAKFVDSPATVQRLFTSGAAWIGYNGSGRAALSIRSGLPVGFVNPDEGAPVIRNYMDVLKNAPHPDLARKFLNMAMAPKMQQEMAEALLVAPTNKDVKLPPDVASKVPYGPDEIASLEDLDLTYTSLHLDELTRKWLEVIGSH